jgi:RNase P/RNase MRP subunit p29
MSSLTRGELQEIQAGLRPGGAFKSVTFDGGITSGKLSTKAAVSTSLTGANNDMTFTADTAGVAGNSIQVAYHTDRIAAGNTAALVNTANKCIHVDLKTSAGVAATKVLTSTNTELADGDTVTIDGKVYRFKDTMAAAYDVKRHGTTADTTMGNLIKAINGTGTAGTEYFAGTVVHPTVSAGVLAAHAFTVTARTIGAAGNALAIAESSAQLSWASGATTLGGGEDVNQVLSLASEVKTAIEANAQAAALVDLTYVAANDGTGVVTAMSNITLAGGSDGKVSLFTVTGPILCSLRGYCATSLTGTGATLVHGVTGTTNMLIPILTSTNITVGKGIDSTSAVVARGTALAKTPLWLVQDETIFITTATADTTAGKINYVLDYIALTDAATVVPA